MQANGIGQTGLREGLERRRYAVPANPEANTPTVEEGLMRRLKLPLTALLALLFLVDAVVGFRLLSSGWPKHVSLSDVTPGVAEIRVMPVPFTGSDWLILAAVIAAHTVLFISCGRPGALHLRMPDRSHMGSRST